MRMRQFEVENRSLCWRVVPRLCATEAAVFDTLFATSTKNAAAGTTPSPFDAHRDGLVIGEGAGCLILEDLEHAKQRGAKIFAEIVGFGTNSDGCHVTQPNAETMQIAMELALEDSGLQASEIALRQCAWHWYSAR